LNSYFFISPYPISINLLQQQKKTWYPFHKSIKNSIEIKNQYLTKYFTFSVLELLKELKVSLTMIVIDKIHRSADDTHSFIFCWSMCEEEKFRKEVSEVCHLFTKLSTQKKYQNLIIFFPIPKR
jgi:hypothetical protein